MATTTQTPNNVYIQNEIRKEKCFMGQIDERWLWQRRMGHIRFENVVKVSKNKVVRDMPKVIKPLDPICKQCQHASKQK